MRLRLDARARRLVRRLPVLNVYSLAELALLALLAVQTARLVWTVVTPVTPLGDWRPAAPVVAETPGDILRSFDPFFRLDAAAGPATVTSLQLTLFGTRFDEAMGRGSAILAGPDGVQKSVAVGEEVAPGVRLKAVAFDHVTLDRGGADEDLFLDQSSAVQPVAPIAAAPATAETGTAASGLRAEIGVIPRIDGGRLSGLVVRPLGTGALFRRTGLRTGDVVTAFAGRPVTGPDDLDRVAADLATGTTVPITVERGTKTLQLTLSPPTSP